MTEPKILREELVAQSVFKAVADGLPDYGYTLLLPDGSNEAPGIIHMREQFPTPDERNGELSMMTLAFGFNVDDGGRPAELGSDLTEMRHTLTAWVFGLEENAARRLATAVRTIAFRNDMVLPLYDFNQDGNPQIDALVVDNAPTKHEVNNSPRPWDQYVWTCAISVTDWFYPS